MPDIHVVKVPGYRYCADTAEILTLDESAKNVAAGLCDLEDHLPVYVEELFWEPQRLCDATRRDGQGKVLAICGLPLGHTVSHDLP